ncbi:MAG: flagellin [Chlamydiales bacterium]|jgi:flagellin|nr:flagellin [Chlamydiales bacterium]
MFLNQISSGLYVDYARNVRNLAKSSQKMSSGLKSPTAAEGAGEVSMANKLRQTISANNALAINIETAKAIGEVQSTAMQGALDIVNRMYELAYSAVDGTKTTGDRAILDQEYKALLSEMSNIANSTYYRSQSLLKSNASASDRFTITYGTNSSTDVVSIVDNTTDRQMDLSAVYSELNAGAAGITGTAAATTAINLINDSTSGTNRKLNIIIAAVGAKMNEVARIEERMVSLNNGLGQAEASLRYIDVAKEAANFTQQQINLSASQSILAQANNFTQGTLKFFQ